MSRRTILTLKNETATIRVVRDSYWDVWIVAITDQWGRREAGDSEYSTKQEAIEYANWLVERPEYFTEPASKD